MFETPPTIADLTARSVAHPMEWSVAKRPVAYPEAVAAMEARVEDILAGRARRTRLARRAPPALHRRNLGQARGPALPGPLSGPSDPPRRRIHLSRAWAARRLRDARPQPAGPRRARLRLASRGVGDPHAGRIRRHRQAQAGRVGVWVTRPERPPRPDGSPAEDKIAAIGVRVRRWVVVPRRRDQRRA